MAAIDRRSLGRSALATLLLAGLAPRALAQSAYPSRPVHLVVGFTPGAAADISARLLASGLAAILGQPVVVENKPGAGSSIAADYVAHAANDGYTLFLGAAANVTNQIVNPDLSFNIVTDFSPITLVTAAAVVLVVNPASQVHSVAELIALARSKPGAVLYGSTGVGAAPHLAAELFAERAAIKLVHVPYQGSPQAIADLIAGRTTMMFAPASAVIGQITSGHLTALASAATMRPSILPNVPTMAEAGMPDFDTGIWFGLLAPKATPRPIIDTLATAAQAAMHKPDVVATLARQGIDPLGGGPDDFKRFIASELERWSAVARAAGLKS